MAKVKVKVIRTFRGDEGLMRRGDVMEVEERRANELVAANLAVIGVGEKSVRATKNKMVEGAESNKGDGASVTVRRATAGAAGKGGAGEGTQNPPDAGQGDGTEAEAEAEVSTSRRTGSRTGGKRASRSSSRPAPARGK